MTNPDGIRWHDGFLYIAENVNGLSRMIAHGHQNSDRPLARPADIARDHRL